MILPRILILDDLTGWSRDAREQMCDRLALLNLNEREPAHNPSEYLAEAVFRSGQVRRGNELENDVRAALAAVAEGWDSTAGPPANRWGLVLLDLQFDYGLVAEGSLDPDSNWPRSTDQTFGLKLMHAFAEVWPDPDNRHKTAIPVVVLSKQPRQDLENALNNLGNLGYLEIHRDNLKHRLADHLFQYGLLEDIPMPLVDASSCVSHRTRKGRPIIGKTFPLLRALRQARQAARSEGPCLLLGAAGSGKELLAEYVHNLSPRQDGPYVAINCAGIPDTLIEMELFGYSPKSGIDGADPKGKLGKFELANTGTLFLDEIGDMSGDAQAKVLRAMQEKLIERLGATSSSKVDVRFIAATNKDLYKEVTRGSFRDALLSRLGGFVIDVPTLEQRRGDIPRLFNYFLERETNKLSGDWPKTVDGDFYQRLMQRSWPTNIRQLEMLAIRLASERLYGGHIPANDAGTSDLPELERTPENLKVLASMIAEFEISVDRENLRGSWSDLNRAYGTLLLRTLEIAFSQTKDIARLRSGEHPKTRSGKSEVLGDLSPTAAISLLLDRPVTNTIEACDYVNDALRLFERLPKEEWPTIDPDSLLGRFFEYLKHRRSAKIHRVLSGL